MMGAVWFVIILLIVTVGLVSTYLIMQSNANTRARNRELEFKKAEKAILLRKQKALSRGDSFEIHVADSELDTLTARYIAGKDHPE